MVFNASQDSRGILECGLIQRTLSFALRSQLFRSSKAEDPFGEGALSDNCVFREQADHSKGWELVYTF